MGVNRLVTLAVLPVKLLAVAIAVADLYSTMKRQHHEETAS
jgi:hypothetical protein